MGSRKLKEQLVRSRRNVRAVTKLNEGDWRWEYGFQAGLAMGVPVALFTFIGEQSLGLIASLGAFTGLYCAGRKFREHLVVLPLVGLGFVLSSLIGVVSSINEWVTIASLIAVSIIACTVSIGSNLGAPGGAMFIIVAAASNHIAIVARESGRIVHEWDIPLLVGAGAFLAFLTVIVLMAFPFMRDNEQPLPPLTLRLKFNTDDYFLIARIAAGVVIASMVGMAISIQRTYWVIVAVAAILQGGPSKELTTLRAVQRVLGTLIGVVLFEIITLIHPAGLLIVLLTMVLQFATQVVIARNYALGLIFVTPLALINTTVSNTVDRAVTVNERIIDTIIGAIIAIVVFWLDDFVKKRFIAKKKLLELEKKGDAI